MDINNTVIPTKSTPTRTNTSKSVAKSIGSPSSYASTPSKSALFQGQVIKGEITDLRNNEVTVTLENNSTVTGTVTNGTELSIGQTAAFKVIELSPKEVVLEAVPTSKQYTENITINKALLEAQLPKNEKNQSIVRELLRNQLSINKQSILTILQQSLTHKNTSISTLVLMNKHNIPITDQNTTQFEHYRNYEHRIITEVESISNALPELLETMATKSDAQSIHMFGNQLLSLALDHPLALSSPAPVFSNQSQTFLPLSDESRDALIGILDEFSTSEELKFSLENGTANIREVVTALQNSMVLAQEMDNAHIEVAINSKLSENKGMPLSAEAMLALTEEITHETPLTSDIFHTKTVNEIFEQYAAFQREHGELATFLSPTDRTTLLHNLEDFPLAPTLKDKIISGEATIKNLLSAIKNSLSMTTNEAVKDLFTSKEFKGLFKEGLLANWTLTPKTLVKQNEVDHFYTKLYDQLTKLSEFITTQTTNHQTEQVLQQSNQIKDNLDFMKTLNTMFHYVQLPMKLKEQNIHSDLYVYTNKKNLKNNKGHIHVLLHLDMENLGPLDVKIVLDNNQVNSTFYINDEFSTALITNNLDQLEEALNEKGFLLTAQIEKREKEVDIVKDFIEKDMPSTSLKRYNFDIRA